MTPQKLGSLLLCSTQWLPVRSWLLWNATSEEPDASTFPYGMLAVLLSIYPEFCGRSRIIRWLAIDRIVWGNSLQLNIKRHGKTFSLSHDTVQTSDASWMRLSWIQIDSRLISHMHRFTDEVWCQLHITAILDIIPGRWSSGLTSGSDIQSFQKSNAIPSDVTVPSEKRRKVAPKVIFRRPLSFWEVMTTRDEAKNASYSYVERSTVFNPKNHFWSVTRWLYHHAKQFWTCFAIELSM